MEYKTPIKKLIKFFQKSRDKWKDKAQKAKKALKVSRNRILFLEQSKAKIKAEVKALKLQLSAYENKQTVEKILPQQAALKK